MIKVSFPDVPNHGKQKIQVSSTMLEIRGEDAMCIFQEVNEMKMAVDHMIAAFIFERSKVTEFESKWRMRGFRAFTLELIEQCTGSLRQGNLTREQADHLSEIMLDRLGYNSDRFEEVAEIIESVETTDGMPQSEPVTRRLASWRRQLGLEHQEEATLMPVSESLPPAVVTPPVKTKSKRPTGKKARKATAESVKDTPAKAPKHRAKAPVSTCKVAANDSAMTGAT